MSAETFQLRTPQIRANCLAFISQIDDPETLVVIKNKRETRTAAQHSLKWAWMGFLEKQRAGNEGWSRDRWNAYFKGKFIRSLLIEQDPEYHAFFTQADRVLESAPDEGARQWSKRTFLDAIKTEWLNVKNMAEFMTLIDRHCTFKYKIQLPVPDDLKWAIEK